MISRQEAEDGLAFVALSKVMDEIGEPWRLAVDPDPHGLWWWEYPPAAFPPCASGNPYVLASCAKCGLFPPHERRPGDEHPFTVEASVFLQVDDPDDPRVLRVDLVDLPYFLPAVIELANREAGRARSRE